MSDASNPSGSDDTSPPNNVDQMDEATRDETPANVLTLARQLMQALEGQALPGTSSSTEQQRQGKLCGNANHS